MGVFNELNGCIQRIKMFIIINMILKLLMLIGYANSICLNTEYTCSYFSDSYFCSFEPECFYLLGLTAPLPPSSPPSSPPSFPDYCNECFDYFRDTASGN
jgi:hypothetical protein